MYDSPSGGNSTFHVRLLTHPPFDNSDKSRTEQFLADTTNIVHSITINDSHRRLTTTDSALQAFAFRVTTRIPPLNNSSWKPQGIVSNLPPAVFGDRRHATELLRRMLYHEYVETASVKDQTDPLLTWHYFCRSIGIEYHAHKLQGTHGVYTLYTSTNNIANSFFDVLGSQTSSTTRTLSLFGSPACIIRIKSPLQWEKFSPDIIQLLDQATEFYSAECITLTSPCIQSSTEAIQKFPQIPGFRGFGLVPATKRSPAQVQLYIKQHPKSCITSSIVSNNIDELQALFSTEVSEIILKQPIPRQSGGPFDSPAAIARTKECIEEFRDVLANFFHAPVTAATANPPPPDGSKAPVSSLSKAAKTSTPPGTASNSRTTPTSKLTRLPLRESGGSSSQPGQEGGNGSPGGVTLTKLPVTEPRGGSSKGPVGARAERGPTRTTDPSRGVGGGGSPGIVPLRNENGVGRGIGRAARSGGRGSGRGGGSGGGGRLPQGRGRGGRGWLSFVADLTETATDASRDATPQTDNREIEHGAICAYTETADHYDSV
ncbi:MAG: hypothetical protein ACREBR_00460 [bacterium]